MVPDELSLVRDLWVDRRFRAARGSLVRVLGEAVMEASIRALVCLRVSPERGHSMLP